MNLIEREGTRCRVQRCWEGRTVVCIAGGPSLTQNAIAVVRAAREADAVRVIAINDAYLLAPWADAAYFADAPWWKQQGEGLERRWPWLSLSAAEVRAAREAFAGPWVSIDHPEAVRDPRVYVLENDGRDGLCTSPYGLRTGMNSGYQAINLAVLAGAQALVLFGYDMRHDGTRTHAHNGHKKFTPDAIWREIANKFDTLTEPLAALGVQVLNCSPNSRIAAFPKFRHPEEALSCSPVS